MSSSSQTTNAISNHTTAHVFREVGGVIEIDLDDSDGNDTLQQAIHTSRVDLSKKPNDISIENNTVQPLPASARPSNNTLEDSIMVDLTTVKEKNIQQVIQASLLDSKPIGISIERNAQLPPSAQSTINGRMEDAIVLDLTGEEDETTLGSCPLFFRRAHGLFPIPILPGCRQSTQFFHPVGRRRGCGKRISS
jgi:hypothetical protein